SVLNTRRQSYMGGLIGDSRSRVSRVVNSYFDRDVSGITTPADQGKTTEEMKNQGTYVNWDFDGAWSLKDGEYPKLRSVEDTAGLELSGEGTEVNPYIIETKEQLDSIRKDITACYKLGSDIDLNNETWMSISQFSGTLDGDGYVIRNLDTKGTGSF
ncbi:hypothetical protein, partial [Anaerotignum propionicum]|uniref:hypothetical protein n=1 Tax=Anaerotignum propionicum TaxID=28446 RepID=UPI002ED0B253|nr:hypothetical protein [Anaerotignum propionicum]